MPYTTPHTITVGELVTVDTMNDEWGGNVAFLANPPACRVYHNAAQSTTTGVELSLALNSERWDTDTMHSTVTNNSRITFTTGGLYLLVGHIEFAANATGYRLASIRWQNTTTLAVQTTKPHGTFADRLTVTCVYGFGAGEWVELRAFQDSGGSLNVNSTANFSPELSATWIGRG